MNFDWISFLIGFILGWLVEWIIDWLYWRNKRISSAEVEELQDQLAEAEAQNAELQASLADTQAELDALQARYDELEASTADLEGVRVQLAQTEAGYVDLQNQLDQSRIAAIGRLTRIDGIDEEMAGRLYDAGIASSVELVDYDQDGLRVVTGLDDDAYDAWWRQVAAALGLGMVAARLGEDEPEMFVAAPDLEEGDEIEGDLIVEEILETYDFDDDGEVDLVIETVTEGVDFDADGEIDLIVDQRIEADILDEDAVAAAEEQLVAEIDAELEEADAAAALRAAPVAIDLAPDDLTLIQGIGPRFAEKLAAGGILTFAVLADASDEDLDAAIQPQAWQKVDYDSWRNQARTFAAVPLPQTQGDDLQLIEGIGPKYSELLRAADILTFAELADTEPERLAEIIGAPAWRNVNYESWIAQAGLAAAGDQAGLQVLQEELYSRPEDNILLIHGLGNKYAAALEQNGITTFAALAVMTPEQLEEIISAAGLRNADFNSWIQEAKLRAAGKRVPRTKRSYKDVVVVSCPQDLESIEGVGVIYERRLYEAGIGSYWEVAQMTDEELTDVLEIMPFQDVDLAEIRASAMALAVESGTVNRVWDGTNPDDFETFEGIGVIYERRLYNAGYCTYEALAAATPEELEAICRPPAFNKPDFASWIATAQILAAAKGAREA